MNVTGLITLFVREVKENKYFSTTVSHKAEDGSRVNCSIDVYFSKGAISEEVIKKLDPQYAYKLEIKEGFLSCREYQYEGQTRKSIYVQVQKCGWEKDRTLITQKAPVDDNSAFPF